MQCVILAGGLGTRIRTLAGELPKSLIDIQGKPFIAYQLQALRHAGVRDVVLCIGYQGAMIRAAVGDGTAWDLNVRYVDEGGQLRGTGGALRFAGERGLLEPLTFVMYGDSFLPIDFAPIWAYFKDRNEPALMTVLHNQGRWDKSNVRFERSRIVLYDKKKTDPAMAHIDYGLSLIRRDPLMAAIPVDAVYDLADYFSALSRDGQLAGYEVDRRFYEIGSPEGIADFKAWVAAQEPA